MSELFRVMGTTEYIYCFYFSTKMILYKNYCAAAEPNEIKAFIFVVRFLPDSLSRGGRVCELAVFKKS